MGPRPANQKVLTVSAGREEQSRSLRDAQPELRGPAAACATLRGSGPARQFLGVMRSDKIIFSLSEPCD